MDPIGNDEKLEYIGLSLALFGADDHCCGLMWAAGHWTVLSRRVEAFMEEKFAVDVLGCAGIGTLLFFKKNYGKAASFSLRVKLEVVVEQKTADTKDCYFGKKCHDRVDWKMIEHLEKGFSGGDGWRIEAGPAAEEHTGKKFGSGNEAGGAVVQVRKVKSWASFTEAAVGRKEARGRRRWVEILREHGMVQRPVGLCR
mmetsp:Transcript_69615/g.203760  ORF Transcript_69615/g.203760 Transcript_69615/m.203760 type:complete len:198 (+) Transcript_69615:120-713(+)